MASSSAARTRMRSSSVIWCQRVPRRCPVLRTLPAASRSRSSPSTWSRFPFARSASSDVVSPPFPDNSDSTWSAGTALERRLAFGGEVCRLAVSRRPSAERAVSRVLIWSFSSASRVSIESTISWVVLMPPMLRKRPAPRLLSLLARSRGAVGGQAARPAGSAPPMNCSTHSPVICRVAALMRFQALIPAIVITRPASWDSS